MARIEPDDLRTAPLVATPLENESLQVFIDMANDVIATDVEPNADYEESRLKNIERFLAAHYATASDPSEASSGAGEFRTDYETPSDTEAGLEETRFGRRAMELDPDGTLARLESAGVETVFKGYSASYDSHGNR